MSDGMKNFLSSWLILLACFNFVKCFPSGDAKSVIDDVTSTDGNSNGHDFVEKVRSYGYIAEKHFVESDGYNLTLHRISGNVGYIPAPGKKVVYIQHGLFMSSVNFVMRGPDRDLAFILSDAGYDVWLGNARGNTNSRSHKTLKPDDAQFWDFSYHEIALGDVKTFIDYTLNVTNKNKLTYVGYSSGSTEGFALLSTRPEYNKKINLLVDIAPIVFWKHNRGALINAVSTAIGFAENINYYFGWIPQEIFSQFGIFPDLGKKVCESQNGLMEQLCGVFLQSLSPEENISLLNKTMLALYLEAWPAGASARTLFHFGQNMRTGEFRAYDYGSDENLRKYGSYRPPKYPLENVTAPVAIYYGETDIYSVIEDIDDLKRSLPNVVESKRVENFSHFLWSDDIKQKLFDPIVKLISNYTSNSRRISLSCLTSLNESRSC
ncbi:hypothetical protein QAD02_003906 [Eretmocerus hayati]|uniref:Uncharacterized protein n=1 Tax=Eretmocerus hayati TaxID=131215 RepID=A0ACC2NNG1_9HYME|nr:hypothetical protein QAD02_003906 [Eretmocerus hayati]